MAISKPNPKPEKAGVRIKKNTRPKMRDKAHSKELAKNTHNQTPTKD